MNVIKSTFIYNKVAMNCTKYYIVTNILNIENQKHVCRIMSPGKHYYQVVSILH